MTMASDHSRRVVGLDVVRLIACLLVCIVHFNASVCVYQDGVFLYPNTVVPNFIIGNKVYLGTLGVKLFFLVSGVSLMLSYKPENRAIEFYRKRVLSIYPAFWIAFCVATVVDFFLYKGMPIAHPMNLAVSFAGLDGYLGALNLIPWEYYKVGEWLLGCILLLYLFYPLTYGFLARFPKTACASFGVLYLASLYAVQKHLPYIGSSNGLTICACELFLGMSYIRFDLHKNKKTFYAVTALCALALLYRDRIPSDLLTLAIAAFMLDAAVRLGGILRSEHAKDALAYASASTYPIFLVHHFLSDHMVRGFDLSCLPRMYVYMMFAVFVAGTLLLAVLLKKLSDRFTLWLRGHKRVMSAILVLLALSYVYTSWEVVRYSME